MSKRPLDDRPKGGKPEDQDFDDSSSSSSSSSNSSTHKKSKKTKKSDKSKKSKKKEDKEKKKKHAATKRHRAEESSSDDSSSDSDSDSSSTSSSSSSSSSDHHHKKKKKDKSKKDKKRDKDKKHSSSSKSKKSKSEKSEKSKKKSDKKSKKKDEAAKPRPKTAFITAVSRAAANVAAPGLLRADGAGAVPSTAAAAAVISNRQQQHHHHHHSSTAAAANKRPVLQEAPLPSAGSVQLQKELEELRSKFNVVQQQEQIRALEELEAKKQKREAQAALKSATGGGGGESSDDSSFDFNAADDDDHLLSGGDDDGNGADNSNARDDHFLDGLFDDDDDTQNQSSNKDKNENNQEDDDEILALFSGGGAAVKADGVSKTSGGETTTTMFGRSSLGEDDSSVSTLFGGGGGGGNVAPTTSSSGDKNLVSSPLLGGGGGSMADALLAFAGVDTNQAQIQQQEQQQQQQQQENRVAPASFEDNNDNDDADDEFSFFRVDKSYEKLQNKNNSNNNQATVKELPELDDSEISSEPIEKDFYIPPSDIEALTEAEVKALLESLDGAQVKGKNPPRPMRSFDACGLNDATVAVLRRRNFLEPFAVQSLAVPALMSGRDLFLTAKTGSGKTLAYLLPLIRHVYNQRRARSGEGPVGLVIVPTHELAEQIEGVARDLMQANQLRVMRAYGSVKLEDNVRELSGGVDVAIATPGRLKGICVNGSRTRLFLSRVSFVVLDEVDRLMDEGLGRTVQELLVRVRPDHQIALVSSTIPEMQRRFFRDMFAAERKQVVAEQQEIKQQQKQLQEQQQQQEEEDGASSLLVPAPHHHHHQQQQQQPSRQLRSLIEISVGGKPNPSTNVTQSVEFFDLPKAQDGSPLPITGANVKSDPRWRRLVQILGDHYENTDFSSTNTSERDQVIVFVESKELCDHLYVTLEDVGYTDLVGTLYAGRDNDDRRSAVQEFSSGERPILIATAVAERGLDVLGLSLVINYDVPNHFEAYVNRVGRTGRAGRRGKAVTFFLRGVDEHLAHMLVRALDGSQQLLPDELKLIADQYELKVREGIVQRKAGNFATGYGRSKTFTFRRNEGNEFESSGSYQTQQLLLENGGGGGGGRNKRNNKRRKKDDDDDSSDFGENDFGALDVSNNQSSDAAAATGKGQQQQLVLFQANQQQQQQDGSAIDLVRNLLSGANQHRQQQERGEAFSREETEFDINQYGERVRRRLTARQQLERIGNETGTGITVRGRYVTAAGRRLMQAGERELHLHIRGPTQQSLHKAVRALQEIVNEESSKAERTAGFYDR